MSTRNRNNMQSLIIISKDKDKAREYLHKIANSEKISPFDIFTLETEKQVGIGDIRGLSKNIFLKPLKGNKKIITLECFYGITVDAQNAFLKILEEPPVGTIIAILAHENLFLPTILSRCSLITLDNQILINEEDEKKFLQLLNNLDNLKIGDKLKIAQDFSKDKESALNFIEKIILIIRKDMIDSVNYESKDKLIVLQKYFKEIKESNVNTRLGLENLLLEL